MKTQDGLKAIAQSATSALKPVLLLALLLPVVSQAQPTDAPTQANAVDASPSGIEERRAQPRMHVGIGGGGGVLVTDGFGAYTSVIGGVGFSFDGGVQLKDRYALYARVTLDTLLLQNTLSGAVLGEVGFGRLSVAAGLGLMASFVSPIFGSAKSATFVTIPIVLGITPFDRLNTSVARKGFHIWLEGALGKPINGSGTLGGSAGIRLGYIWS